MAEQTRYSILPLFLSCLLLLQQIWAIQADIQSKQWKAKYVHGSELLKADSKLEISIGIGKLAFWRKGIEVFSIPPDKVESVFYDNKVIHMSTEWLKNNPYWYNFSNPFFIPIGLPLIGLGTLALLPYNPKDHFIHLIWSVDGLPHMAVLELGKKDFREFLAEISQVTGKPWHNLPEQRERLKRELESAKDTKIPFRLDREARIFMAELSPGLYQLILLERSANYGELYFFRGKKVKPNKVVAAFPVSITREENSIVEAKAIFRPGKESGHIEQVLLPGMILRVLEESGGKETSLPIQ